MNTLLKLLNLIHPIVQAPMAGVQDHRLAVAVSSAGALGAIPAAMLSTEALDQELRNFHENCLNGPLNLNFFCHVQPPANELAHLAWLNTLESYYAEFGIDPVVHAGAGRLPFSAQSLDVLRKRPPAVVSFHFGLPQSSWVQAIKALGCQVWSSATTVSEAKWLQAHGADAIIAQGLEAGGHRGHFLSDDLSLQMGTFALLPQVVAAVNVPVIAAGGIASADGVTAALQMGASAVQIGTAFLCCEEATTSAVHRQALQSDAAQHTQLTRLFTGRPARGITNRLMRELGAMNPLSPEFPLAVAGIAPLRAAAEKRGSSDFSPLWSGQNTQGCASVPAAELIQHLSNQK